jgi:hypothetical protein
MITTMNPHRDREDVSDDQTISSSSYTLLAKAYPYVYIMSFYI